MIIRRARSETTFRKIQSELRAEPHGSVTHGETAAVIPGYVVKEVLRRRAGVPYCQALETSRFVGRERELAILHERLADASRGEGQVIGVAGQPGIGMSRLLREFRRSLNTGDATYLEAQCLPHGGALPICP